MDPSVVSVLLLIAVLGWAAARMIQRGGHEDTLRLSGHIRRTGGEWSWRSYSIADVAAKIFVILGLLSVLGGVLPTLWSVPRGGDLPLGYLAVAGASAGGLLLYLLGLVATLRGPRGWIRITESALEFQRDGRLWRLARRNVLRPRLHDTAGRVGLRADILGVGTVHLVLVAPGVMQASDLSLLQRELEELLRTD